MTPGDVFLCYQDVGPEKGCYHAYSVREAGDGFPSDLTPIDFLGHTCRHIARISFSKKISWYEGRQLLLWVIKQ